MNRTGLFIALAIWLVIALVFGIFPELDLKLAALFYDSETASFPLRENWLARVARDGATSIAWAFVAPAIIAVIAKLIRPERRLLVPGRAAVFLIVTMILSAGVLTNFSFKAFWGRPRPVAVTEFGGTNHFVAWWNPRGDCPRNCSFFSGEGATAFWTLAPAALAPPQWRLPAYGAAIVFGSVTSLMRMAFGGHFFTDVAFAALASFIAIWLFHGVIYRWQCSAFSDEAVERWLSARSLARRRKAAGTSAAAANGMGGPAPDAGNASEAATGPGP